MEQDLSSTKALPDERGGTAGFVGRSELNRHGDMAIAAAGHRGDQGVELVAVAREQRGTCAVVRELPRDDGPEDTRRAGNDDDSIGY